MKTILVQKIAENTSFLKSIKNRIVQIRNIWSKFLFYRKVFNIFKIIVFGNILYHNNFYNKHNFKNTIKL